MKRQFLGLFLLICGLLTVSPAVSLQASQKADGGTAVTLGPKDGTDLPPTDLDRVKVGDIAPDFTLENLDSQPVTLSQFRGKQNVLLILYRGYW